MMVMLRHAAIRVRKPVGHSRLTEEALLLTKDAANITLDVGVTDLFASAADQGP